MTGTSSEAPRAAVVYESMFGCTEAIAHSVTVGLEEVGFTVTARDVRTDTPDDLPPFDLLVVGAPTHAFSLSRPATRRDAVDQGGRPDAESVGLREWLEVLAQTTTAGDRLFAAFDTRVGKVRFVPKAAATRASRLLVHQGYHAVSRPTPFIVHDVYGPVADGEQERARQWGRTVGQSAAARMSQ
ncbi:MAG: hypothetical protein Q8Q02_15025 [Nocardioides sp.]|nr:hypothetical protein [Nocardioides sp.]